VDDIKSTEKETVLFGVPQRLSLIIRSCLTLIQSTYNTRWVVAVCRWYNICDDCHFLFEKDHIHIHDARLAHFITKSTNMSSRGMLTRALMTYGQTSFRKCHIFTYIAHKSKHS